MPEQSTYFQLRAPNGRLFWLVSQLAFFGPMFIYARTESKNPFEYGSGKIAP